MKHGHFICFQKNFFSMKQICCSLGLYYPPCLLITYIIGIESVEQAHHDQGHHVEENGEKHQAWPQNHNK